MSALGDRGITLEGLAAAVGELRQELATWKALAHKQDQLSVDQITATQSGATAAKISQIAVNTAAIQALAAQVAGQIALEYVSTLPATGEPLTLYLVPQGDGTAPNYCDEYLWINDAWELIGTTGAMANNGELTIQVNGVAVGTFTANQAANAAVNITVPTNTNQLVNGAQFVDAAALAAALTGKQDTLTTAQLAAANSGITAAAVQQISTNTDAIATKAADADVVHLAGAETISGDKTFTGAVVTHDITPETDNTYSLGSSTLAWSAVYAGTYYYGGTAWGLDKANVWTALNSYNQSIQITANFNIGAAPSSDVYGGFNFGNSASSVGNVTVRVSSGGATYSRLYAGNKFANEALDPNGTWKYAELQVGLRANGDRFIYTDGAWRNSLIPYKEDNISLGTSTNKWKTLNGINPGALSLPGSNITLDTTNWDLTGTSANSYTPTADGWIVLRCKDVAGDYLFATWSGGAMRTSVTGQGLITFPAAGLCLYMPVKAGTKVDCVVKITSNFGAFFYPCLGNV